MKILLVDDDVFLRDMYATKFTETGHDVQAVEGGADALRALQTTTDFDVMIVDMIMPGMTGVELMEAIRSTLPDLSLKVIVLSNQGQDQDIDEAKAVGAIGYIIKAQSIPSEVVAKVEKIMSEQH